MLARILIINLISISLCFSYSNSNVLAADGISLYTPFKKISVPPGESINYSIDVINKGSDIKNVTLSVSEIPKSWDYSLKSGGWNIKQISVLPGEKKTLDLKVDIPRRINKGDYRFKVIAAGFDALPLEINISEQGTYKTEFTSDQVNMEGHAKANFTFTTKLKNQTGEKQLYSLRSNAPRGWEVVFKPNYKQATAVEIEPNSTSNISIEIKPPYNIVAGSYKIPVQATNNKTLADLELEVVITGSFEMELTTPEGLLSASSTAGREKQIELLLKNKGSETLKNSRFSASKPARWEVSFEPDTVPHLKAGESARVMATVKSYDKAIPGDYVINFLASTDETNSTASFRISLKTPMLWAWLGVLIIIGALGSVYYLFRKYGRR
ncbi:MAG: hypothetical protein JXB17_06170 [Bacteroidales bacterium]|nr:hypothetical protein [Bacteroidales bacterium]